MTAKTDLIARKSHLRHNRLPRQRAQLAGKINGRRWIGKFLTFCLIALSVSLSVGVFVILSNYKGW